MGLLLVGGVREDYSGDTCACLASIVGPEEMELDAGWVGFIRRRRESGFGIFCAAIYLFISQIQTKEMQGILFLSCGGN